MLVISVTNLPSALQASRDPSLLPVSFHGTIIDQDLVHALLENEPDRVDAFKYANSPQNLMSFD
jgi:hypothetical protein